ncbi:hypothetical protein AFEL58S_01979 [Afipia felis]
MSKPGRIACLNPKCGRTAPDDGVSNKIVCGKCWRKLPAPLRHEWKRFKANEKRLHRLVERRIAAGTVSRDTVMGIGQRRIARHDDIWRRIEAYFTAPSSPPGLENFLKEVGL